MISTLPIENLGGVNGVYKIWVDAGKLVFKQSAENLTLLESATAVMRAALDKIKFRENGNTSAHDLFKELALSDIEVSTYIAIIHPHYMPHCIAWVMAKHSVTCVAGQSTHHNDKTNPEHPTRAWEA